MRSTSPTFGIEFGEQVNATQVAATVEVGGEEDAQRVLGLRNGGDTPTEAGDVGVVVSATQLGILGRAQDSSPHTGDLVGSHADAESAATYGDAPVRVASANLSRDSGTETG